MTITETEVRIAADEYRNVGVAYQNAINAFINFLVEKKRFEAKPGFFARMRLDRRQVDAAHFAGVLLSHYSARKGRVPDASDVPILSAIIMKSAELTIKSIDDGDRAHAEEINRMKREHAEFMDRLGKITK